MNNIVKGTWSRMLANKEFICIETVSVSGSGLLVRDPKGVQHLLSHDASDRELGLALLDALSHSRFDKDLYDYNLIVPRYNEWVSNLLKHFGYKTKRALFKDMMLCDVENKQGFLKISPSHHEKLEAWSGDGLTESDNVVIPSDSSPEEIGAALRLALSRCT